MLRYEWEERLERVLVEMVGVQEGISAGYGQISGYTTELVSLEGGVWAMPAMDTTVCLLYLSACILYTNSSIFFCFMYYHSVILLVLPSRCVLCRRRVLAVLL